MAPSLSVTAPSWMKDRLWIQSRLAVPSFTPNPARTATAATFILLEACPSLYPELSKAPQFRFHQAQGQTSSLPSSPPWLSHSTVLTLTSDPRSSFRLPLCLPPYWHARVPGRELPLLPPLPTLMPFRSSCIIVLFPSSLMSCWLLGAGYMGPDLFLSEVGYWPATPISP